MKSGENRSAEAQCSAGRRGAQSSHRDEMAYSRRKAAHSRACCVYPADSGTDIGVGRSSTHHDSANHIIQAKWELNENQLSGRELPGCREASAQKK